MWSGSGLWFVPRTSQRARLSNAGRPASAEGVVPQYDFLCQSCKRLFTKNLTLPEYEQTVINCPYCGTDDVEQGRWIAFHLPDTKSA
jgi:DNA-directed RNA polymerase subunit RPC12/RpoP